MFICNLHCQLFYVFPVICDIKTRPEHVPKYSTRSKKTFYVVSVSAFIFFPARSRKKRQQCRVVRKPVNANPGLKVNRSMYFSCIKTFFTDYVLCSLKLFTFKTEGQKR